MARQADGLIAPGQQLGATLRLDARVGAGGMGEVWRARDLVLDRDVAVKLLFAARTDADQDATDEFVRSRREARACAQVVHPNVVAVYGVGEHAARPWIAMEWVQGPTLRAVVSERTPRPDRQVRAWIAAIGDAVHHAHERGVVHCDIKPENILMQQLATGELLPKLVDFGLARGANLAHRKPTQQRGTRAYLAPEAGLLRPAPAADQYSLAIVLCELLSGARPAFSGGRFNLPRHLRIDATVGEVLTRALSRDPGRRFADVAALIGALDAALECQIGPGRRARVRSGGDLGGFKDGDAVDEVWLAGLPKSQLRRAILGIIAAAPPAFPEAVMRIARVQGVGVLLAELAQDDTLEGSLGGFQLRDPQIAPLLLDALPGPVVRGIRVRVADELVAAAGGRDWMLDAAILLYAGAGELAQASMHTRARARAAVTAHERDRLLTEAVALVAAPERPAQWLDALLERLEWSVACGWTARARRILSDAFGVVAEAGVELANEDMVRLANADGEIRLQMGDAKGALSRLGRVEPDDATPSATRHGALMVRALLAARQREAAASQAQNLTDDDAPTATLAAKAAIFQACRDHARADQLRRRALAAALDDSDRLAAAMIMVKLAEGRVAAGQHSQALRTVEDAADLVQSIGAVRWTGRISRVRAALALAEGRHFAAMRHTQTAIDLAHQHGTTTDEVAAANLMVAVCNAAADPQGAEEFERRARQLM